MKLLERMKQQKLLSTTLLLFTLGIGIVIGTLVNTGVNAARAQNVAPDATPLVIPNAVETGNEFSKLAKKISPSVVNITADYTTKQTTTSRRGNRSNQGDQGDDDGSAELFRRFFGGQTPPGLTAPDEGKHEQSGTGFIVDKNGYILTNKHVISDEQGGPVDHIKVKLHGDDAEYRAKLIGFDRETDVAVLKIDAHRPLQPVMIGNSDSVQVGDWAVAMGSPFGLQETVTAGIVSAMNRANIGEQFQRFIQTDAAINPGNSGGPLLNIRGEVIGINTMIATRSGGYEGIGFALPVNMAVRVYNDIIRDGHVTRGSIGVTFSGSKPEVLRAMGFDHGVIIEGVHPGGPADKAGVKVEDIITGINGKPLKDGDELQNRVADLPVGTSAVLNVDRDGKKLDLKLVVEDRVKVFADDPRVVGELDQPASADVGKPEASKLVQFGFMARPLTDDERQLTPEKRGVMVTRVEPGSFAAEIDPPMQDRDIITSVNRQPVNSTDDIKKVQAKLKPGDAVAFHVVRSLGAAVGHSSAANTQSIWLSGTLPD